VVSKVLVKVFDSHFNAHIWKIKNVGEIFKKYKQCGKNKKCKKCFFTSMVQRGHRYCYRALGGWLFHGFVIHILFWFVSVVLKVKPEVICTDVPASIVSGWQQLVRQLSLSWLPGNVNIDYSYNECHLDVFGKS